MERYLINKISICLRESNKLFIMVNNGTLSIEKGFNQAKRDFYLSCEKGHIVYQTRWNVSLEKRYIVISD